MMHLPLAGNVEIDDLALSVQHGDEITCTSRQRKCDIESLVTISKKIRLIHNHREQQQVRMFRRSLQVTHPASEEWRLSMHCSQLNMYTTDAS